MDIFALLGRPIFLQKSRQMLVEVNRPPFAAPVRQFEVIGEENHEPNLLFGRPVLVLEDAVLYECLLLVLPLIVLD